MVPSSALCPPSSVLCIHYGLMSPPRPLHPLRPSAPYSTVPSMALCPCYGPLSLLRSYVLSTALCLLYPSTNSALCPLYGPLSPLWPSVPSMALCPLYGPLSLLQPLCLLYGSLTPLPPMSPLPQLPPLPCLSSLPPKHCTGPIDRLTRKTGRTIVNKQSDLLFHDIFCKYIMMIYFI
jgi:hypothetical protein